MTNLLEAIKKNDLDRVKYLVNTGMSNANTNVLKKDDNDYVPLNWASCWNRFEIVKFLVSSGVDILEKDDGGWTALHWASRWGHFKIVEFLVELGIDIEAVNTEGKTAIDVATLYKQKKTKEFLIEQLEIQKNGGYILK